MTVENLKFIQELMKKNLSEVKKTNESLGKYIGRVQFFLENADSNTISTNIFQPTEKNFKVECIDNLPPPCKEEFTAARHYIIFQDESIKEEQKEDFVLEKWQNCMEKLLLEVDLSAYYNKCIKTETQLNSSESELLRLLRLIYKSPTSFLVDPDKTSKIKLFATYLINYLTSEGEKNAKMNLEALGKEYRKSVEINFEKQQRVEHNLRLSIGALNSKLTTIKYQIVRYNNDVFHSVLAEKFIKVYECNYEIYKINGAAFEAPKHKSFFSSKPDPNLASKEDKYVISFPQPKKKGSTHKKSLAGMLFIGKNSLNPKDQHHNLRE